MQQDVTTNSLRAWVLAARPKTLAGAAVPVVVGCALAFAEMHAGLAPINNPAVIFDVAAISDPTVGGVAVPLGGFRPVPAVLCLVFAFLMQIDANLINDLWDFRKGSDGKDRLGPERACAQGWITPRAMMWGICITTLAACMVGCGLLFYGGWWLVGVGVACVLFAFLYTAGPYPLAYHGWGDAAVIVFFGFVPVGCTYYLQCGGYGTSVVVASVACGLVIDTLLMVNNYRDREQDANGGKRTLVVRLGARVTERLYLWLGWGAVGVCLLLAADGHLWAALLPLGYLLPHTLTWRRMVRIGCGRELNGVLGATSCNMLIFGVLLALGLLL